MPSIDRFSVAHYISLTIATATMTTTTTTIKWHQQDHSIFRRAKLLFFPIKHQMAFDNYNISQSEWVPLNYGHANV